MADGSEIARVDAPGAPLDGSGSDQTELARNGLLTAAGLGINGLFTFGLAVVVARGLGASGTGTFYEAVAIFTLITLIGQFGADIGLLRVLPKHVGQARAVAVKWDIQVALVPVVAGGVLFAVGLAIVGLEVAGRPHDGGLGACLVGLSVAVVPAALSGPVIAATRAFGSTKPFVVVETVAKPGLRLIAVLVTVTGFSGGVTVVVLVWGVVAAVTALIAAGCLRLLYRRFLALVNRQAPDELGGTRVDAAKRFWRFSAPRALGSALEIMLLWVDVVILEVLRGPTQAGIYSAAIRYLALGTLALSAAVLVVAPQVSAYFARGEIGRVAGTYKTSTLWLCIASLPIVCTTAVFAPTFMLIFGVAFTAGATALTILSIAMAVNVTCGPVNSVLLMGGGSVLNLGNAAVAVALNVALNLILVPSYGLNGSATAWAVAIVISNLLPVSQVYRRWKLHPGSPGLVAIVGLAVVCYAGLGVITRISLGTSPAVAALAVTVSTALYGAGLWGIRETAQLVVLGDVVKATAHRVGRSA